MKLRVCLLMLGIFAVLLSTSRGAGSISFSSGNFASDGQHMTTGKNGRAQVGVDAHGGLVRLGSNTVADLGKEGGITLTKGLLLVSSGEGFLRRSGIVVHTSEGLVTVRGTALVAVLPDGAVKLTCLEGGVRGDLGGQEVSLHAGELTIQRHDGSRDTVQVNLNTLAHTCTLIVGEGFKPLHSADSIDKAVLHQNKALMAEQQHAADHYKAAHVQGESGGFLTRLFSGHGASSNQPAGSVGGATMMIARGGNVGGTLTLANSGGTLASASGSSLNNNTPTGLVVSGANLTQSVGPTSQQVLISSSGGTFVQSASINGAAPPVVALPGTTVLSGGALNQISGGQLSIAGGSSIVLSGSGTVGGINATVIGNSVNFVNGGQVNLQTGGGSAP